MADSLYASISKGSSSWGSSSGGLESLKRASSLYSHQQSRNFAKLAVDSLNVVAAVHKGLTQDDVQQGVRSDTIKGDLGDDEFEALCKDRGFTLTAINYCQRGLEDLGDQCLNKAKLKDSSGKLDLSDADVEKIQQMKKRAVINHDYLVLELQPGDRKSKEFYILAEKLAIGGPRGIAGIYISYKTVAEADGFLLNDSTKLYAIKCGQKHIPLDSILAILKEESPHYSLRNDNCWDYATKTAKRLALKCSEVSDISAEKTRFIREHEDLEANLNAKNMYNIAKTVMGWVSS